MPAGEGASTTGTPPAPASAGFLRLADGLHRATRGLCIALVAALLGVELAIVLLRYGLGTGFLELQDLAVYLFASLVALGLPVALADDAHVRVDVLRERQGPSLRRRIDAAGVVLLLFPAFALTLWLVLPEVRYAWSIREGSRETGGLGGVFLIKTVLPVACALMLVQGAAALSRSSGGSRDDEGEGEGAGRGREEDERGGGESGTGGGERDGTGERAP